MDNQLLKTIPVETAMEYYAVAAERGRRAGAYVERQRILAALKDKKLYEAILVVKATEAPNVTSPRL